MTYGDGEAGRHQGLQLSLHTAPDAIVLACRGAIDGTTRHTLGESIDRALDHLSGRPLALDLTGVHFIDSTGLQALMHALLKCDDASAAWTLRPSQQVERLLVLVGIGRLRSDQTGNWLHGGGYGDQ